MAGRRLPLGTCRWSLLAALARLLTSWLLALVGGLATTLLPLSSLGASLPAVLRLLFP